jgi:hypothetical protein
VYDPVAPALSLGQVEALQALIARVDLAPGPGGSRITLLGARTDDALAILGEAYGEIECVAAVILYPSSQLVAHCDQPLPAPRLHLPLHTNEGCWSFSGGVWQQLVVGEVYRMDPTLLHGAVNWGPTPRVHLMLDLRGPRL